MNTDVKYAYFIFVKQGYKITRNKLNKRIGYGDNIVFMYETSPIIINYAGI